MPWRCQPGATVSPRGCEMPVLVSFCNMPAARRSGVLSIGDGFSEITWVAIGPTSEEVVSCSGLWVGAGIVHCVWIDSDGASRLTLLDRKTWTPLATGRLEGVKDPHSVAVLDGWLYVVSTGTDEVRRLPANDAGGPTESVWKASAAGVDTHHLNSILPLNGQLLCSAFGPKSGDRWSTALNGYVIDISSERVLAARIEQPHSLCAAAGGLYVIESRRKRIRRLDHSDGLVVDGYARGLTFLDATRGVVGLSRGRTGSRSLGIIENPCEDQSDYAGHAGLVEFRGDHQDFVPLREIDLSEYSPEIYDVVAV